MVNFCSKCGAKQEESDSKFCIECGALLKEDVKENAVENKTPTKAVNSTPKVVSSTPTKAVNSVNVNTMLCPFCKKQIPINSSRCPFCNNVINANANKHTGALIVGYLLSFLALFSTFLGLQAVLLSLFLMILSFIAISYLFSRDSNSVNVHAGVMSFLFILSLIIICANAQIMVDKIEAIANAFYWAY